MKLAITYAFLALIASGVNIGTQDYVVQHYTGAFYMLLSVATGTAAGLLVKYLLDKRYIFRFRAANARHDGLTFARYVLMGLATTAIFWGVEFGFQYLFETKQMRYLGGALGLAIGYLAKYRLDKRFVFVAEAA